MEVLRVIVGHVGGGGLGLGRGGIVVCAPRMGRGQVGQHLPHAQEMAQRQAASSSIGG